MQTFQAEIQQILNILVHSLYKDREIFLRELISNASDALNRVRFEMLANRNVLDPDTELAIHITVDEDAKTIQISDTGIGMTAEEMVDSLGVIARSGAKAFLEKLNEEEAVAADIIGQFGVGFYSVFMVAERVEVTSRSYDPEAQAARWVSTGEEGYTIEPAERETRGTDITIHLREDAHEFASRWRLQQVIKRHSDFVTFPIYIETASDEDAEDNEASEPVNQQQAIWRRPVSDVEDEEYNRYYSTLTMDFEPPLMRVHMRSDAPFQFYTLLFIPSQAEGHVFSPRTEPGLALYARKVLIQEYTTDLLPEYLKFVQGVVDSEDLPLNVSRETVQDNPLITKLRRVLTREVLTRLKRKAKNDPETYTRFWDEFGIFLKQGIVTVPNDRDRLVPLLRFTSDKSEGELISLQDYVEGFVKGQDTIYYVVADDEAGATRSPHLDAFRARGIDVLYLTDTVDGFVFPALQTYEGHAFASVDSADVDLEGVGTKPEEDEAEPVPEGDLHPLLDYIREHLADRIEDVRVSKVLGAGSAARLVTPEGGLDRHQQRLYQLLDQEYEEPIYLFEVNARHPIVRNLAARLAAEGGSPMLENAIELLYQNALLADGIHPDPSGMAGLIQRLLEDATD